MNDHVNTPFHAAPDMCGSSGSPGTASDVGSSPEQILVALESTIVNFERLIANRSHDELHQAAQDGGWGIVEILSHVQDWEEVAQERVRSILEEECPELEDYDDSLWAIEHDYGSQDGHEVFACVSELRRGLIERLQDIEDGAWQRRAALAGHGEITLRWLMEKLVKHDTKHLGQAREVFG